MKIGSKIMSNKVMMVSLLFNRQPLTKKCLENLFNYTLEPFDLFLWDNGSEKPTLDLLDKLENLKFVNGTTITIIRNKVNVGISDSQAALQKFRKPNQHFIKLDNDVIVPKDATWLTMLCEILEKNTEGFEIAGYTSHPPQSFYSLEHIERHIIKLSSPLTTDGRVAVDSYKTFMLAGFFLISSKFMDRFTFPSGVRKYGEGCDAAIGEYCTINQVPMGIIRTPSMPDWMDNYDHLVDQCPEWKEYHAWKVECLHKRETGDFKPISVGNDPSELRIRKDLLV